MAKATKPKAESGERKAELEAPATMGLDVTMASPGLDEGTGDRDQGTGEHDSPALATSTSTSPALAPSPSPSTRPCCERHVVLMQAYSSTDEKTYYRCPVPGCEGREARVRVQVEIPSEPRACPQRTCRTPEGEPLAYLELKPQLSSLAELHMACPACGFKLRIPRPQFAAQVKADAERQRERDSASLDAR